MNYDIFRERDMKQEEILSKGVLNYFHIKH